MDNINTDTTLSTDALEDKKIDTPGSLADGVGNSSSPKILEKEDVPQARQRAKTIGKDKAGNYNGLKK